MGQKLNDRLPERFAKVRINRRRLTLQQADYINEAIEHNGSLPTIGNRLVYAGGFTLMGHLAVTSEADMQRFLEQDFLKLMDDDLRRKRQLKVSPAEIDTLREGWITSIPGKVKAAMAEIRLALGDHGMCMGMTILHWDNLKQAA